MDIKGTVVLWLTAMIPKARPPPCKQSGQACKSTTTSQYLLLVFSFLLLSIGAGGIRSSSLAFGANQFDKGDNNNPNKQTVLESFFSWYYTLSVVSVMIALTGIVYLQDRLGWKIGFGVPAILMFLSALFFFLASPFYQAKGPQVPTEKLRFLNKACIIKTPEDVKPNGVAANPWNLCTVEQVEELKALIRVMPLWSTGIMISINLSQSSFPLLQAQSMNRHLTKGFQIPAGSFGMFLMIALTIWVLLYDRVMLPLASKIKGRPVRLKPIVRMGLGIFVSCMSMVVSGIIENIRRRRAISEGLLNNSQGLVEMSAMWLIIPNSLNGIAEALNAIGATEFYYSELPKSMSSIASALLVLICFILWFVAGKWQYGPSVDVDITVRMMEPSHDEADDDDEIDLPQKKKSTPDLNSC
ncbi:hypothetical protein MTR67_015715 [Solanum verrucosum]|uniref:Uncharacterized protein n=1 Tax=Solanum verrucosum TaxID=315347 RepID=A0AAF0TQP0_SOLVR|nr:hypothetical protein MTR67_015715 [Solanum verrucosum]